MSKAIEQSVKHKLKTIENSTGVTFNRLLETLFLERILVRISKSIHKDKLIFKGGMCLAQFLNLGRGTKDIDFLLKGLTANEISISEIFDDVSKIDCNDGFVFSNFKISQLSLENKKYPGYRISMEGSLGQIKNKSTIDLGVGDIVRPRFVEIELLKEKDSLFEDSIELNAYPPEFIFSEKLEAIIYLDEINGRMKDFYDCYMMVENNILDKSEAALAVRDTFKTRGTELGLIPERLAIAHDSRWKAFVKKENLSKIEIHTTILTINNFLIELNVF